MGRIEARRKKKVGDLHLVYYLRDESINTRGGIERKEKVRGRERGNKGREGGTTWK